MNLLPCKMWTGLNAINVRIDELVDMSLLNHNDFYHNSLLELVIAHEHSNGIPIGKNVLSGILNICLLISFIDRPVLTQIRAKELGR